MTREQLRREALTAFFAKVGTLATSEELVAICRRIIHKLQMKNYKEMYSNGRHTAISNT